MTENDLQKRLVQNLKAIRKAQNLTQEKLAEKAELSTQIINDIEGGRRWPRRATLARITDALQIDIQSLFVEEKLEPQADFAEWKNRLKSDLRASIDGVFSLYET